MCSYFYCFYQLRHCLACAARQCALQLAETLPQVGGLVVLLASHSAQQLQHCLACVSISFLWWMAGGGIKACVCTFISGSEWAYWVGLGVGFHAQAV